jgi:UDP-N-acetylmuramate dehydrogenase
VRAAVLACRLRKAMVIDPSDPDTRSVGFLLHQPGDHASDAEGVAGARRAVPPAFPAGGRPRQGAGGVADRAGGIYQVGRGKAPVGLSSKHTLAIVTREGANRPDVIRFPQRRRAGGW